MFKFSAIISIFCMCFLCMPQTLFADENIDPVEDGGIVIPIEEGEIAPFSGLLLDNIAVAKILADFEQVKEEAVLVLEEQKVLHQAEKEHLQVLHDIELQAEKDERQVDAEAYEAEIQFLTEELKEDDYDYVFWLLGGIALGGLAASAVVITATLMD